MQLAAKSALLALLYVSGIAAQSNLVQNGDFNSGDEGLAGWTTPDSGWYTSLTNDQYTFPNAAFTAAQSLGPATLYQAVQGTLAQVCYKITFSSNSGQGDSLSDCGISVAFGDLSSGFTSPGEAGTSYTYYARASKTNDVLTFQGYKYVYDFGDQGKD